MLISSCRSFSFPTSVDLLTRARCYNSLEDYWCLAEPFLLKPEGHRTKWSRRRRSYDGHVESVVDQWHSHQASSAHCPAEDQIDQQTLSCTHYNTCNVWKMYQNTSLLCDTLFHWIFLCWLHTYRFVLSSELMMSWWPRLFAFNNQHSSWEKHSKIN